MPINIYADGACRGNGKVDNVGGYGIVLEFRGVRKEIKSAHYCVTNNKMELLSCIEGLRALKKDSKSYPIRVYSDSKYITSCINEKWYKKWRFNGWKTSSGDPVKNPELWQQLLDLYEQFKDITFVWVKGHSSNEGNNRADQLANEAMDELLAKEVL
jgi:ribonuclease HI